MSEDLRRALNDAVHERGITDTARRLGYSNHTLLSRILRGHVRPSRQFWGRVERAFARRRCPALEDIITLAFCAAYRAKAAPTHNPAAMQQWKTCLHCIHRKDDK
jgi:hypothetical protein